MEELENRVSEQYLICPCGRVYSRKTRRFLKPSLNTTGYPIVGLTIDGKTKTFLVHRLVALKYLPNPKQLPEINHKDENPLNSKLSNLEWCDRKYNCNYGHFKQKHKAKSIKCLETDKIYDSIGSCERDMNISNISLVIKGVYKQMNGYHFIELKEGI